MKYFKQFTLSLLAVAATAASAATQPFTAATASITVDTSVLTANKLTAKAVGNSTFNATTGVLTDPVSTVNLATSPGALNVAFDATSGLAFYTPGFLGLQTKVATLQNLSFDLGTGIVHGDLLTAAGDIADQDLLLATTLSSSFGTSAGTNVTSSTATRTLGVAASNFTLAPSLVTLLGATNAASFQFVATSIKSLNIGTVVTSTGVVPEPSTYALMGLGLVGIAAVARRKQA
jgi:hypothetical protein